MKMRKEIVALCAEVLIASPVVAQQMERGPMNALQMGAYYRSIAHDMAEWQPMDTAPRDGTVVEIRQSYGVAPWYAVAKVDQ